MWLVAIEEMKAYCLACSRCIVNVKFLPPVHQRLLGEVQRFALHISLLDRVLRSCSSVTIPLSGHCCPTCRVRHKLSWGQTCKKSLLSRSVFHDPSAQEGQSSAGFPRLFLGNNLTSLQPDILGFCALVSTLVRGWAAPLRDLTSHLVYPASPELLSNPHRLSKEVLFSQHTPKYRKQTEGGTRERMDDGH